MRIGEDSIARYGVARSRAAATRQVSANLFLHFSAIATRSGVSNLGARLQISNSKSVRAPVLDCLLDVPGLGKVAGSYAAQQLFQLVVGGETQGHDLVAT